MRTRLGKRKIEDTAVVYSGTTSNRPAPGMRGRYYFCTDTLKWCRDTGTAWQEVGGGGGGGTPSDSVTYETTYGQSPAAGSATPYSRGDHTHGSPTDPVPAHAALPGAHHTAFTQADHDALPNPHHAQAHTLTSHSTRAHSELTNIGADDHHPQTHNHDSTYAPITKGVTNGDSHDHNGGDGAQVDHVNLANKGSNTHAQVDTHLAAASPHSSHATLSGGKVPTAELGGAGADNTKYLRGDQTWEVPPGGSGTLAEIHIPMIQLAAALTI